MSIRREVRRETRIRKIDVRVAIVLVNLAFGGLANRAFGVDEESRWANDS